jgi:hypothetical protein
MRERTADKLCEIEDRARTSAITKDATVSCGLCGAKAHDPANVCDPVLSYTEKTGKRGGKTK